MDFGRLPDLRYVDFRLPPDHPDTTRVLARAQLTAPPTPSLYVGCPIWTNKEWLGSYFPLGIKEPEYLHYYAQQFNSLELNTTHYRIPDAPTVRRWREAVGPGFRFCPKLPRSISHERELYNVDSLALTFTRAIAELEDRLGPCFCSYRRTLAPKACRALSASSWTGPPKYRWPWSYATPAGLPTACWPIACLPRSKPSIKRW